MVTADLYILSGHRRYLAAGIAGLTELPCRIEPFRRADDAERYLQRLREYNRQREKSFAEKVREAAVDTNPDNAEAVLIAQRRARSKVSTAPMELPEQIARAVISDAKEPFLSAILRVLKELRDYWPVSERQIHYNLLNGPPLIHASKPHSTYRNDHASSRALSDLIVRATLAGHIPEDAIGDETRPVSVWKVYRDVSSFIAQETEEFCVGYWRDPLQSQPNHIELVVEKNTIANILRDVAAEYCVPLTSGRGFASLPPRIAIKNRYLESGKEKLILILVSDFDPSGEWIATSLARSMRDDFGLDIHPVKAALRAEQVQTLPNLPESLETKSAGAHYKEWQKKYGAKRGAYELEAVPPPVLQRIVRTTIESTLDWRQFNEERAQQKQESVQLKALRDVMRQTLGVYKSEQE